MKILWIVLTVVACYFIGNINFALIISKLKKSDIRKQDSGNPGTMNMLRNYGTGIGALTLILDMLKGSGAAILGWFVLGGFSFGGDTVGMFVGGTMAIIGHIYPVFLGFKGGKGIASSIGVCLVLNPIATAICFVVGALFMIVTKQGSVTSFIIISFPLAFKCLEVAKELSGTSKIVALTMMLLIFLLTFWAHRSNLKKLFIGKERKTKAFSKKGKASAPQPPAA